jgi:spermidine/putrescine-binding protein
MTKKNRPTKLFGLSACLSIAANAVYAEGTLNLLTWEGYADPSFIKPFEAATGCKVTATFVGSNDDYAPKLLAGGGVYDLITPTVDTTMPLILNDLVEPLDLSRIPRFSEVFEIYQTNEGIIHEGETYGVPWVWGANPMMYVVDKFETPPTTIAELLTPEMEGRLSFWDDKTTVYLGARLMGHRAEEVFDLTDEELLEVREKLIEIKPNVRKYWASAGELVNLYASGEVWASNTWGGYQIALLAEEGIEAREFIPEEGVDGWMDVWQIVKGTENLDCAYEFLNMTLAEEGQCGQVAVNGYAPTNPVAVRECLTEEQRVAMNFDSDEFRASIVYQQNLGDRLRDYVNTWNAVKSAN